MLIPLFTRYNEIRERLQKLSEELDKVEHEYEVALSEDKEMHVLKDIYLKVQNVQRKRSLFYDIAEQNQKLHH